jgi:hypothetical protein
VIASSRVFLGEHPVVTIDRLSVPRGVPFDRLMATGACLKAAEPCPETEPPPKGYHWKTAYAFVKSLSAHPIATESFPIADAYRQFLSVGDFSGVLHFGSYWQDSPVRYRRRACHMSRPFTERRTYAVKRSHV